MFNISFSKKANKEFEGLEKKYKERVEDALRILSFDPVPVRYFDVVKLKGVEDTYRIRIGKIRIVYNVIWKNRDIVIFRVKK